MDQTKIGHLIAQLRREKGFTQKQLADQMRISDRAISKWERGLGCPDVSLLPELSNLLDVNIEDILNGNVRTNEIVGGNMKQAKYYVCQTCSNLVLATGSAAISCCGRKLDALVPTKASEQNKLIVTEVEDDWLITSHHPMTKEQYISFIAFATGDQIHVMKQYPEWDIQTRIQKRRRGTLLWYSSDHQLFYQYV